MRRLTDPAGVGADVIDAVAELYRRRAHGRPDGDTPHAWHVMSAMIDIAPWRARGLLEQVENRLAGDDDAVREVRGQSALAQLAAEPF